jgi:hypothetical protein
VEEEVPLPAASVNRKLLHTRVVECRGFERDDGLYDVEGSITDVKSYPINRGMGAGITVQPGEPIHKMFVRLTVDDNLVVHDITAVTDAAPFPMCPEAIAPMAGLKGLKIGAGWTRAVRERLAGAKGCTHLMELLGPVATTAFQTLVRVRMARPTLGRDGRPSKIDSCYAFAADRDVVRERWPEHYTGPQRAAE